MTDRADMSPVEQKSFDLGFHDALRPRASDADPLPTTPGERAAYLAGVAHAQAGSLADYVHREVYVNGTFKEYRESANANIEEMFERIDHQTKIPLLSGEAAKQVQSDAAFQKVLPEITLMELRGNFDKMHDPRNGETVSLQELKDFAVNCEHSQIKDAAMDYAIKNFAKIHEFDPGSAGISKTGLDKAISTVVNLESEWRQMESNLDLESNLKFLDKNFDDIHKNKAFPGINPYELDKYLNTNCGNDLEKKAAVKSVQSSYGPLSSLDTSDGDKLWYTLWIGNDNAEGITRSDIAHGLKNIKEYPKKSSEIQDRISRWGK